MAGLNKILVSVGTYTLVQSITQLILTVLSAMQYYCVVDIPHTTQIALWIRLLYFYNPDCGTIMNIGSVVDGMADQAFMYIITEPYSTFKHFIVTYVYLATSTLWLISSIGLIIGGAKGSVNKGFKFMWLFVQSFQFGLDIGAVIAYASDIYNANNLSRLADFVGGTLTGAGNYPLDVDTRSGPFLMVASYSRFGIGLIINLGLFIFVLVDIFKRRTRRSDVEMDNEVAHYAQRGDTHLSVQNRRGGGSDDDSAIDESSFSQPSPRDGDQTHSSDQSVSQPTATLEVHRESIAKRRRVNLDLRVLHPDTFLHPPAPPMPTEEKRQLRSVTFPTSLLSLPQRLEKIMADQQRKLNETVIDTSSRRVVPQPPEEPQPSVSTETQIETTHTDASHTERRGTTAGLQGQLPWSYISTSTNRMRDQLPPDEELPPVPVPDYTVLPPYRKASVQGSCSSVGLNVIDNYEPEEQESYHSADESTHQELANNRRAVLTNKLGIVGMPILTEDETNGKKVVIYIPIRETAI